MLTIRDVAAAAGVSVATASRALNGNDRVDPKLARRVLRAAERIQYRPNAVARSLRRQVSTTLALIIPDISNPFFTAAARGAEDLAHARGFNLLLSNTDEDHDKEATYLRVAEEAMVTGVILAPRDSTTDITRLRRAGIPVALIDRHLDQPCDGVFVDSRQGARDATEQLLKGGWRRPACITGPRTAQTATDRAAGYTDITAANALDSLIAYGDFRESGGRDAARLLLNAAEPPDSFVVANAAMALGLLGELGDRGLQVGVDIGAITFDDAPWAPYVSPPMAVVAQPAYKIGSTAAAIVIDAMQDENSQPGSHQIVLPTQLVVRASARRAAPRVSDSRSSLPATSA
ncbi:LacI family DNA-binding transcriptional regulator [Amycolatopsis sp. NPDC051372]|uniref:LacI family DNA-binding transcriptional regulator n=1 Tax=Amycolatopsis sp. NPDC051372 TaxID=3155669 RepID=UPI00344602CA